MKRIRGAREKRENVAVKRGTFTFTFRIETSGVREQAEEINYIREENERKREEKYREEMRKEIREGSIKKGEYITCFKPVLSYLDGGQSAQADIEGNVTEKSGEKSTVTEKSGGAKQRRRECY